MLSEDIRSEEETGYQMKKSWKKIVTRIRSVHCLQVLTNSQETNSRVDFSTSIIITDIYDYDQETTWKYMYNREG